MSLALTLVAAAYLLGAIPFGLVVTRVAAHEDVRLAGSGNIGATNVARVAGKRAALLVLLLDMLKGFGPTVVAAHLLGPGRAWWVAGVGLAAFLGHVFPVYLRFRGGKGVATALGVCLALVPVAAALGALVYVVVFKLSRISSLGSLIAASTTTLVAFGASSAAPYGWLMLAMMGVILLRHRSNIARLVRREEGRV